MTPGLGFSVKNACAATNRPIKDLQDIFVPPAITGELVNSNGISTGDLVIQQKVLEDRNLDGLYSTDSTHMPGRIQIADVSSDGFPDVMFTAVGQKGTETHILLNSPCIASICSSEARDTMRRAFRDSAHSQEKFANDDLEIDPRAYLNEVYKELNIQKGLNPLHDDFGEFLKPLKNI